MMYISIYIYIKNNNYYCYYYCYYYTYIYKHVEHCGTTCLVSLPNMGMGQNLGILESVTCSPGHIWDIFHIVL